MGIVHMLGIVLLISGLVIFTASAGYMILHIAARLAYHWRRAAHVIEHTWEPEPIPGFIGSMMIEDDGEWDGRTFAFAPAPMEKCCGGCNGSCANVCGNPWIECDCPIEPAPDPGPLEVTAEWLGGFPQWDQPTRTQAAAPAWLDEALRAQDDDAALFLSWFRSQVAASRVELAKVLT